MNRPTLLLAAASLDAVLGDPESFPHPVRLIGNTIAAAEPRLNPHHGLTTRSRPQTHLAALLAGSLFTTTLIATTYVLTATLLRRAHRLHPALGAAVEIYLAATTLAARNLHDEAVAVLRPLEAGDLPFARQRLARIVGRDTATLDAAGISRALIETLAESSCDGIVAPLFFLALGGVPAAMAFKTISTLDSMIGHHTPRYEHFGKLAARLDDAANLIPARLTALLFLAQDPSRQAWTIYARDRNKHASPNAGHPEAAIAATLHVQLGGPSTYDNIPHQAPRLAPEHPLPTPAKARRALRLTRTTALLATLTALCLAYRLHAGKQKPLALS